MLGLRSIRWSTACGTVLLGFLAAALCQPEARACDTPTEPEGLSVTSLLVPVDGALTFQWQCRGPCTVEQVGTELEVSALDPVTGQGTPVEGEVTRRGVDRDGIGWGSWRPGAQLVEGKYGVRAPGSRDQPVVTVVRSLGFDPRRLFARGVLSVYPRPVGDRVCCDDPPKLEAAQVLVTCPTAPKGYEAAWRNAKQTLQRAGLFPQDDDELGEPPVEGATVDAGFVGGAPSAETAMTSASGGCQLNRGRRSGVGAFLASLLLLGLAARKRTS